MLRPWYFVLGIGLLILWLVGLGAHSASWLMWLVFAGGCLSIIAGVGLPVDASRSLRVSTALVISIGLYILWIVGLGVGKAMWKNWWTFAFACAYLLLAIGEGGTRRQVIRHVS